MKKSITSAGINQKNMEKEKQHHEARHIQLEVIYTTHNKNNETYRRGRPFFHFQSSDNFFQIICLLIHTTKTIQPTIPLDSDDY